MKISLRTKNPIVKIVFICFVLAVFWASEGISGSEEWFKKDFYTCFSRKDNCEQKILDLIDESKVSIDVFAYVLTSKEIANKLLDAHGRGVKVFVEAEGKDSKFHKNSKLKTLKEKGIPVIYIEEEGIFHHKVMIFDEKILATGSYNYTWSAQNKNHENLLLIKDKDIVEDYITNLKGLKRRALD